MSATNATGAMQFISPQLLDEKLKTEKLYWLEKLAGTRSPVGIPLDFPRPAHYSVEKARVTFSLDEALRSRLLQVSGGNQMLAFTLLTAAIKICLHKYTGVEDVVIGTTVHNRHGEIAALNRVIALRSKVDGRMLVKSLFASVKQSLAEAYAHQKYPFQRLIELLEIENSANRQAAFQVAVGMVGVTDPEHLAELKTDLNVVYRQSEGTAAFEIQYCPAVLKGETVEQFGIHLMHVLQSALASPISIVDEIDLNSPDRQQRLLCDFNRTERAYPLEVPLHAMFERQAASTPLAIALECGPDTITYAELDRRANRLAATVKTFGVERNAFIGLFFEHSIEMIVSLLGVLKAGAAYVPLDPSHPSARVEFVVRDAGIRIVLTQTHLAGRLSSLPAHIMPLTPGWSGEPGWKAEEYPLDNGAPMQASPSDLAYLIYTSGSTGQPKGVAIEHRAVVNYVSWALDTYVRGDTIAFPLYSSFAFDLTVTSIFLPLVSGNLLLIYPDHGIDHPLFDALRENRSGFLKLTPSHLSLIVERGLGFRADVVRRVVVGGEALSSALAARALAVFAPDVEIYNEYGPTEATVGCMVHRFSPERDDRPFVPIGKPAANTRIYVLDTQGRPVAENVTGELMIAGTGLARGYHNRPELNEDRFPESLFAPGERIYRSGDLARWLPEGIIEYAGRKDDQVKFHGYRVELNEIRMVLNTHPSVKDSIVVIGKDAAEGEWMAAYYVAQESLNTSDLRAFLKSSVIEETIPNFFIALEELPLTANGKVDLGALPSVENVRAAAERASIAPRTQTEELLLGIWMQVLGRPAIGVSDDFFELGGHSLLAHQIISKARAAFAIEVPLRSLFEATTVEQLAAVIDLLARGNSGSPTVPIMAVRRDRNLVASFGQERLWVMNQLRSGGVSYNIYPCFKLDGELNTTALEQSFNEIVRRHEVLRTSYRLEGEQLLQVVLPAVGMAIPFTDLSSLNGEEKETSVQAFIEQQVRRPFDLEAGPVIRAHLIRLEAGKHLLFIAMHHIASDAASMGIFYRELADLYSGFCSRRLPRLAALPVQYADYAAWQREWLQGDLVETQVAYWRDQLRDAPPVLDLLPARERPEVLKHDGTYLGLMLSRQLSESVRELAKRERCTVFMVLLTAFQTVLRYYARRDDIVVGADVANRTRPELEGLIGFFVNTLALRTSFAGDPKFHELLRRVRESTLAAFSHRDVPFEKLVADLNPDRPAGQNPIFQIMFGFVPNNATMGLELPNLTIKPYPLDNKTSLFDFSLYMADTPDGLGGTAQFNTSLYDPAFIAEFLSLFEAALSFVTAKPDAGLSEVGLFLDQHIKQRLAKQAHDLKEQRLGKLKQLRVAKTSSAEVAAV